MADFDREEQASSQPESNNFDNDFEKLDPFGPSEPLVSTTTASEQPEEDLYSAPSESEATAKLLDFGDPTPPVKPAVSDPAFQPDSSVGEPPAPTKAEVSKDKTASGSWLKNIDPRVLDLIYWRDVKKTGIVFSSMLVILLSLALFTVLSVLAYLSLAALTVTISFRLYKNVLQAVQKSGEGHPFKKHLDCDISLPEEKVHQAADIVMKHATTTAKELRRLFLVEDLVDSIKFGLLLWVLTYIGAWFNGMTLIILAVITVFTIPKVYETNKTVIDQYLDLARTQIRNVIKQVQEKIPFPGKKKQL